MRVRGYSHVFGHAAPGEVPSAVDAYVGVQHTNGEQERYAPDSVREIISAFASNSDPTVVRERVRGGRPGGDPGRGLERGGGHGAPPRPGPRTPLDSNSGSRDNTETDLDEQQEGPAVGPSAASGAGGALAARRPFRDLIETYAQSQVVVEDDEARLKDVSSRCRNALLRYGMSARLEEAVLTPNSALLRFKGADDLTVAKVEARLEELETTHGLQVLSVRALPGQVAISIRRQVRTLLTLPAVWRDWGADGGRAEQPFADSGSGGRWTAAISRAGARPAHARGGKYGQRQVRAHAEHYTRHSGHQYARAGKGGADRSEGGRGLFLVRRAATSRRRHRRSTGGRFGTPRRVGAGDGAALCAFPGCEGDQHQGIQ